MTSDQHFTVASSIHDYWTLFLRSHFSIESAVSAQRALCSELLNFLRICEGDKQTVTLLMLNLAASLCLPSAGGDRSETCLCCRSLSLEGDAGCVWKENPNDFHRIIWCLRRRYDYYQKKKRCDAAYFWPRQLWAGRRCEQVLYRILCSLLPV